MALVAYELEELDKIKGQRCLWCLVVSSEVISLADPLKHRLSSLNIYETEKQRDNALRYWRSQHKLSNTVFFRFEIPIDFYLEKAQKEI